jgi:hypothetical protein
MKTSKILFFSLFLIIGSYVNAQIYINSVQYGEKAVETVWDYPIKTNTTEWLQLKSTEDMYKVCQIPENVLSKLSTEDLVEIVLNYPALPTLLIFNSPQDGFDNLYSKFNGIQALLNRKDAGTFLLNKYKSLSLSDFDSRWTLEKQGAFAHKYYYLEIILAQPQVIYSLNSNERRDFLKETLKKLDEKLSLDELFGGVAVGVNTWVLARTLKAEKKLFLESFDSADIDDLLNSGFVNVNLLQPVYQQSKSYIYE